LAPLITPRGHSDGGHAAREACLLREAARPHGRRRARAHGRGDRVQDRQPAWQPRALVRHDPPALRVVWAGAIGPVHTVHAGCDAFRTSIARSRTSGKSTRSMRFPRGSIMTCGSVRCRFGRTPALGSVELARLDALRFRHIGDWHCHVVDPTFWRSIWTPRHPSVPRLPDTTWPSTGSPIRRQQDHLRIPGQGHRGPVTVVWHDGDTTIPGGRLLGGRQDPGTGAVLIGEKGMIVHGSHGAGGCYLTPEKLMDEYSGKNARPRRSRASRPSLDWLAAIRAGRAAGSNFGYGGPLSRRIARRHRDPVPRPDAQVG